MRDARRDRDPRVGTPRSVSARPAARLPAIRDSTRRELLRRVLLVREYIHSHVSGPVSLFAVARAAYLSPFHFHRGFVVVIELENNVGEAFEIRIDSAVESELDAARLPMTRNENDPSAHALIRQR